MLGERHRENRFIATVPGRGYEFVASVQRCSFGEEPGAAVELSPHGGIGPDRPLRLSWLPAGRSTGLIALGVVVVGVLAITLTGLLEESGSSDGAVRSLAVLPIHPLTAGEPDQALGMGLTDALILELARSDSLDVRSLSAVRGFASPEQDPVDAGRLLAVDAVLTASVQRTADRVRVSARLIRVADSRQLWAESFDEEVRDIFSLQDSIAQRVAGALRVPVAAGSRRTTENVDAYEMYMKGNLHARRLIAPEVQKGIAYYEQAIAIDPSYAMAYVELANAYRAMLMTNDASPAEFVPAARAAAQEAVRIDPMLAEA